MPDLGGLDYTVFGAYFVVLVALGFYLGRKGKGTSEDYFLAGRTLPWYVVGTSFIGSNISTEHFIGMVGSAYLYGICIAQWEWGNILSFSVLIWFFIPFLLASRVFTAPEFLERRYNPTCRLLFAVLTVVANIAAFLAPVLYAAAISLRTMFGWENLWAGVILTAVVAGGYAIYGGLRSVAWTDLFQTIVMVIGGILVTLFGLYALGDGAGILAGWKTMIARNLGEGAPWAAAIAEAGKNFLYGGGEYHRLRVIQPANHTLVPWTTLIPAFLSISIWYNCINQFIVQRVLAARDSWHARMGIVLAMFMKIFLPLIIIIPGLIYFAMDPSITNKQQVDDAYPTMVMGLLSIGLRGLFLAALYGAIHSTIDSVLNSTSTILTLDIYKKFIKPDAREESLASMGKWVSTVVLIIAVLIAPFIERLGKGVFVYIHDLFAHFAPPFAAVFVLGVLWKRPTGRSAATAIVFGILLSALIAYLPPAVVNPEGRFFLESGSIRDACDKLAGIPFLMRAGIVWGACAVLHIIVSLLSSPPPPEKTTPDLVVHWDTLRIFTNLGTPWYRNLLLWYGIAAAGLLGCYLLFSSLLFG